LFHGDKIVTTTSGHQIASCRVSELFMPTYEFKTYPPTCLISLRDSEIEIWNDSIFSKAVI